MRLAFFAVAAALFAIVAPPKAEARPYYEESGYGVERWGSGERSGRRQVSHKRRYYASRGIERGIERSSSRRSGVGGRPSRWCGWWMRTQLGGGPEYNLAANWRRWGRSAGGPQVGAVVVWSHHVGMITGRASNGQWIVKSGNDGGRVRERARSVSGATFRVG